VCASAMLDTVTLNRVGSMAVTDTGSLPATESNRFSVSPVWMSRLEETVIFTLVAVGEGAGLTTSVETGLPAKGGIVGGDEGSAGTKSASA